jgi:hypothetical protein
MKTCSSCGVPDRARVVRVAGWWFNENPLVNPAVQSHPTLRPNLWYNAIFGRLGVPSQSISWEKGRMVDIVVDAAGRCQWCRKNAAAIAETAQRLEFREVAAAS